MWFGRHEVNVLSALQHERIICLLAACMALPNIAIIEELASGGSLYNKLHPRSRNNRGCPLPYPQVSDAVHGVALICCSGGPVAAFCVWSLNVVWAGAAVANRVGYCGCYGLLAPRHCTPRPEVSKCMIWFS